MSVGILTPGGLDEHICLYGNLWNDIFSKKKGRN